MDVSASFIIDTAGCCDAAPLETSGAVRKSKRIISRQSEAFSHQDVVVPIYECAGEIHADLHEEEITEEISENHCAAPDNINGPEGSDSDDEFVEAAKVRLHGGLHPQDNMITGIGGCESSSQHSSYINLTAYRETTRRREKKVKRKDGEESSVAEKRKVADLTRTDLNSRGSGGNANVKTLPVYRISDREIKRRRKIQREKTKGPGWYSLPAQEMTEEKKNDLLLMKWRDALDTKRFYKRSDMKGLPKYFQVGRVVSDQSEYYSSRLSKRDRKATIVDELLADAHFKQKVKKRHMDIMEKRNLRRGKKFSSTFRHMKRMKKNK